MTKKSKIIIITVAAVLAVAVIVGLVFLLKDTNPTGGATPTDVTSSVSSEVTSKPSKNVAETVEKIDVSKEDLSITVEDIVAERGKEILVPITINKNPGIMASAIEFKYNTDKLTYIGYTEGEVFENYYFKETEDSVCFSNIENADSKKSGVLFNLKFKVKDDAVLGDTEIKVNVTNESFINYDEEFIKVDVGNAIVNIK